MHLISWTLFKIRETGRRERDAKKEKEKREIKDRKRK